jgi:hypothetical protein
VPEKTPQEIAEDNERINTMSREEILRAGNIGDQSSADYLRSVEVLDNVVRDCIQVSKAYEGIPSPTAKHFYASVLFTSLISRGVSLATLSPHSPWADKLIEHWDYASAAVIVRTMIEIRAAFHYLCVDECSDEEWSCRWNLLNLHDCISRKRLLEEGSARNPEQSAELETQSEELRERLRANKYFAQLKHQKQILNGQIAYLFPIEEMIEKAGLEKPTYRFLNILFSSAVHGLPMSYYRMGQQERGRGLPSPVEEGYTSICLSLAATLLGSTRGEVHTIFKGLSKAKPSAQDPN